MLEKGLHNEFVPQKLFEGGAGGEEEKGGRGKFGRAGAAAVLRRVTRPKFGRNRCFSISTSSL